MLRMLKAERKPAMEDFDVKEQLFNNLFIFKENFKNVLTIIGNSNLIEVDDLWNSHFCNPQVIGRLFGSTPKDLKPNGTAASKPKVTQIQSKASPNIFPIKEEKDEEEFETPANKQRSQTSFRQSQVVSGSSKRTEPDEQAGPESFTDRIPKDSQIRMSSDPDKDFENDDKRRDSKSVDHTRGSHQKKSEQDGKRGAKPGPNGGGGGNKKLNLDVFSLASGGSRRI